MDDGVFMSLESAARYVGMDAKVLKKEFEIIGAPQRYYCAGKAVYKKSEIDEWMEGEDIPKLGDLLIFCK